MFPAAHSRSSGKFTLNKASSKSGMKVLVDSIRTETPRPRSPHMNNEEPIELAQFPAAKRPGPGEKPKIERDDFPAPPYPYTDPGECAQNCMFCLCACHPPPQTKIWECWCCFTREKNRTFIFSRWLVLWGLTAHLSTKSKIFLFWELILAS
jgi:hypothetical protein